jgi:hypothetical protein
MAWNRGRPCCLQVIIAYGAWFGVRFLLTDATGGITWVANGYVFRVQGQWRGDCLKIVYAKMVNGCLTLPAEALAVLPVGVKLCLLVDAEKGRVTVHAQDPTVLQNRQYFDEMAAEMADVDWREYMMRSRLMIRASMARLIRMKENDHGKAKSCTGRECFI